MTVTEIRQALGEWNISLRSGTPRELLDAISANSFGHVAILPGRVNPATVGDGLLAAARYVGVYRGRTDEDGRELRGAGMAFWLGDEDDKGDVFVNPVVVASASFADSIRAILPAGGAVTEGTLYTIPGSGTFSSTFQYVTPRHAATYITDSFGTDLHPVSWRVNGDGTLDAGRDEDLYVIDPVAILVRREPGQDLIMTGFSGRMALGLDVEDYTTRVVLLAEGEGGATVTASASNPTTFVDIHGNDLVLTRLISESETSGGNAAARAQLQLNRFKNARAAVDLSTADYDVKGTFTVGDRIYVYDPDAGFTDPDQETYWQGQPVNPLAIRVVEMTWPVPPGWTVAFRTGAGEWLDLSDYYVPEGGETTIRVGDFSRSLTDIGSEPIGTRPTPDNSVPATPAFDEVASASYQSQQANDTRAAVYLRWSQPLNQDGSTVLDGDHYEIRYRATQTFNYPITWAQAAGFTWDELQTWGRPLSNPAAVADQWLAAYAGWDITELTIPELMVAAEYELQIRAVDAATPPNMSAWSASTFHVTRVDQIPPNQPAPPEVAASRIAIQVVHRLGDAAGGEFNLAPDLHHLEVHVGGPAFYPTELTAVGRLGATDSNLIGRIPVLGTFQVENVDDLWVRVVAVDRFGNRSSPSAPVQSAALLIDSEHISDLTATKITAGTISTDILLAGSIRTADSGQRAELNSLGLQIYDSDGNAVINLTADDASPNYIGITDGNQVTLASIDSTGNISGQVGTFEDLVIDGESYVDDIQPLQPRGIVAFGQITSAPPTNTTTSELGFYQLQFDAEEGRNYQVNMTAWLSSSVAGDVVGIRLRDGGDSDTVTISGGTEILKFSHGVSKSAIGESISGTASIPFSGGRHQLLLSMYRQSGTGNVIGGFNAVQPAEISIFDTGPTVTNDAVLNDGLGGASTPVQTYTRSYTASWSQTYNESGTQKSGSTVDQGDFGDSAGNRRSLVGFDYATIKNDLSGATISSITITLYAEHWYFDAGGTAVIGTHNYSAKPTTWADSRVTQNRTTSSGWPKPGKRTVVLATTIGDEFKAGTTTGIAIGPGNSSSLTFYGKFTGATGTASNRPVLTIKYTR